VAVEVAPVCEGLVAVWTTEGTLTRVNALMCFPHMFMGEVLSTVATFVKVAASVDIAMLAHVVPEEINIE